MLFGNSTMASISVLSSFTCLRGGIAPPGQLLFSPSFVSCRSRRLGRASVVWPFRPLQEKIAWKIIVRAVAEGEISAQEAESVPSEARESARETVSVPVSPSDMLTMFFKAEGTMDETAETKVSKALEEVDGISDLKVLNLEGIASIELTKQTTAQASGVSSKLVEIIQDAGFKLQTLYLGFEDEEDFIK